jgi:hypothetical protein
VALKRARLDRRQLSTDFSGSFVKFSGYS